MTEAKVRAFPPAVVNPESKPYWDAAEKGKLLYKFCTACKKPHFYPRTLCPFCFSDKTEWKEASGKGVIYSHSTMRRATKMSRASLTVGCATVAPRFRRTSTRRS